LLKDRYGVATQQRTVLVHLGPQVDAGQRQAAASFLRQHPEQRYYLLVSGPNSEVADKLLKQLEVQQAVEALLLFTREMDAYKLQPPQRVLIYHLSGGKVQAFHQPTSSEAIAEQLEASLDFLQAPSS
jgi:hypothetical protein